jgi:hypothetical protein
VQLLGVAHAGSQARRVEGGARVDELLLRGRAPLGLPGAARNRDQERCVRVDARLRESGPLGLDRGFVLRDRLDTRLASSLEQPRLGFDDVPVPPVDLVAGLLRHPTRGHGHAHPRSSHALFRGAEIDGWRGGASAQEIGVCIPGIGERHGFGRRHGRERVDRLHERANLRPEVGRCAARPQGSGGTHGDRRRPGLRLGGLQPAQLAGACPIERGGDAMTLQAARRVRRRELPPATSAQRLPVRAEVMAIEDGGRARRQRERRQAVNRDHPAVDVDRSGGIGRARTDDGGHDLMRGGAPIGASRVDAGESAAEVQAGLPRAQSNVDQPQPGGAVAVRGVEFHGPIEPGGESKE